MIVYRLAKRKFAEDLSGLGAALHGGRWNKKGNPVLYTGESNEIALLELVVHTPPMLVPEFDMLTIEIPDSIQLLDPDSLPPNWFDFPAPTILSEIAEKWIVASKKIALQVPSCIINTSYNYILNCKHPDYFGSVKIVKREKFDFNPRLTN